MDTNRDCLQAIVCCAFLDSARTYHDSHWVGRRGCRRGCCCRRCCSRRPAARWCVHNRRRALSRCVMMRRRCCWLCRVEMQRQRRAACRIVRHARSTRPLFLPSFFVFLSKNSQKQFSLCTKNKLRKMLRETTITIKKSLSLYLSRFVFQVSRARCQREETLLLMCI